jgi:hypothetical protein
VNISERDDGRREARAPKNPRVRTHGATPDPISSGNPGTTGAPPDRSRRSAVRVHGPTEVQALDSSRVTATRFMRSRYGRSARQTVAAGGRRHERRIGPTKIRNSVPTKRAVLVNISGRIDGRPEARAPKNPRVRTQGSRPDPTSLDNPGTTGAPPDRLRRSAVRVHGPTEVQALDSSRVTATRFRF